MGDGMTLALIVLAGGTMFGLAVISGYLLGLANKIFHVDVDPRIEAINAALPGANCGGCGFVGCMPYAEAVAAGKAPPNKCTVGGHPVAEALAKIMGVELTHSWPSRPIVHCCARSGDKLGVAKYRGEPTCAAAHMAGGIQGCAYGCLSLGDCVAACEFDAIHMADGLPVVDYEKCVGCGACARACPRNIIEMIPFKSDRQYVVACANRDFGKDVKSVCKVGCTGCTLCAKTSSVFHMNGHLAGIRYEAYDPNDLKNAPAAASKCPSKCILLVGKPEESADAPPASAARSEPALTGANPS
jgi:electron transport complex protein RnfB